VIEISGLTKHWLLECEAKAKFKECPRCKEAIHTNLYEGHVRAKNCRVAASREDKSRCPLCHLDIPAGDEVGL
jgi:centrosomal protein CEP104